MMHAIKIDRNNLSRCMMHSEYLKKEKNFFQRDPGRRLKKEDVYIPQGGICWKIIKNEESEEIP